jgi:hypothetical protein
MYNEDVKMEVIIKPNLLVLTVVYNLHNQRSCVLCELSTILNN